MSFLLDTDVLLATRRRDKADAALSNWLNACDPGRAFLSVIAIHELERSCETLLRNNLRQGAMFRLWITKMALPQFDGRILPIDEAVARLSAQLQSANPRVERDAFIAATALTHKLSLVTRLGQHFAGTGVKIINPWEE
jgi:toxin FitB